MAGLLAEERAQWFSCSRSWVHRGEVSEGADESVTDLLACVLDDEACTWVQARTILCSEVDPVPRAEPVRCALDVLHVRCDPRSQTFASDDLVLDQELREVAEVQLDGPLDLLVQVPASS